MSCGTKLPSYSNFMVACSFPVLTLDYNSFTGCFFPAGIAIVQTEVGTVAIVDVCDDPRRCGS
jgi:hypothetical protein